jgi:signal transduction histidine kinase
MSIAPVLTFLQIRNPLGAVVHCADSIDESLSEMKSIMDTLQFPDSKAGQRLSELVASSAEAVQIITSCSSHQKRYEIKATDFASYPHVLTICFTRIVDDLLTLSKLDSNLLEINQSPVRATSILDDMRRIFEIEASRAGIDFQIKADPSVKAMEVDNVMLDIGRVHQILINLITNALKL